MELSRVRLMSQQEKMLRDIKAEVRYTRHFVGKDAFEPAVMEAMRAVPRQEFVEPELRPFAFDNGPLPIGYGQTISQPYIVALMTDLLEPGSDDVMLEVGTGSGYQAAVLAQLVRKVYSVEIIERLAMRARSRFERLAYRNVENRVGDGYLGWQEHAPYDGIVVTAAASHVPPMLVEQLKPGARLVIPVGQPHLSQTLRVVEKQDGGEVTTRDILSVAFVPLTRDKAVSDEQ